MQTVGIEPVPIGIEPVPVGIEPVPVGYEDGAVGVTCPVEFAGIVYIGGTT